MSFQGHIENGLVVLDKPVSLPNGTVVRIEPVEAPRKEGALGPVVADTQQAQTMQEMAQAWNTVTKPIPENDLALSVDPDDYPFF